MKIIIVDIISNLAFVGEGYGMAMVMREERSGFAVLWCSLIILLLSCLLRVLYRSRQAD